MRRGIGHPGQERFYTLVTPKGRDGVQKAQNLAEGSDLEGRERERNFRKASVGPVREPRVASWEGEKTGGGGTFHFRRKGLLWPGQKGGESTTRRALKGPRFGPLSGGPEGKRAPGVGGIPRRREDKPLWSKKFFSTKGSQLNCGENPPRRNQRGPRLFPRAQKGVLGGPKTGGEPRGPLGEIHPAGGTSEEPPLWGGGDREKQGGRERICPPGGALLFWGAPNRVYPGLPGNQRVLGENNPQGGDIPQGDSTRERQ